MSTIFVGLHVWTALMDRYAHVSLTDIVVPFTGASHPIALGLGTLSLDIVVVAIVTSLLREKVGLGTWRAVHWIAYASYPAALFHSLAIGSDASTAWFRAAALGSMLAVGAAVWWRVRTRRGDTKTLAPPRHGVGRAETARGDA